MTRSAQGPLRGSENWPYSHTRLTSKTTHRFRIGAVIEGLIKLGDDARRNPGGRIPVPPSTHGIFLAQGLDGCGLAMESSVWE
jgi:hypothetical protein